MIATDQGLHPRLGGESPDRLGSTVKHFPFGDEPTSTAQNREKFATYYRDEVTALDYARNRYYSSSIARFTTADPYQASGGPADPQSWNRYAYVQGDPVDFNDPKGLQRCGLYWVGPPDDRTYYNTGPCPMSDGASGSLFIELPVDLIGPESGPAQPPEGIARALQGLGKIAAGSFRSKAPCRAFFAALAGSAEGGALLMNQVASVAGMAAEMAYVYDGPSSPTVLTSTSFPNAADPSNGISTVGEVFAASPSLMAYSQFDGAAIWINTAQWEGVLSPVKGWLNSDSNSLGLGYLMHELLHKQMVGGGFDHNQMRAALRAVGASPDIGPNDIASSLASACF